MMRSRGWAAKPVFAAGVLALALGLQGCVATTVAGATLGVAGAAVKTTAKAAKVSAKVAGGAVRLTARAARHGAKGSGEPKPAS